MASMRWVTAKPPNMLMVVSTIAATASQRIQPSVLMPSPARKPSWLRAKLRFLRSAQLMLSMPRMRRRLQ